MKRRASILSGLIFTATVEYARLMRSLVRLAFVVIAIASLPSGAHAQSAHKMRIKIDSAPQQAAIYVDNKETGIKGYTPSTIRLRAATTALACWRRSIACAISCA